MSTLRDAFDQVAADVPVYGDIDAAFARADRERHRRRGVLAGLAAAAAVIAVVVGVLVVTDDSDDRQRPVGPSTPSPTPTEVETALDPVVATAPSEVLAARQVRPHRLVVAGERLPGRWDLVESRHDTWVAALSDAVGYTSPALWWGRGTTTHEVRGQRGGVAISQDARWIAWTRSTSGSYSDLSRPWVMEVVDTATGKVRWSRNADEDDPEIGPLLVTNDGVVVFGHCLAPRTDVIGVAQCDDARLDVWAPRSGATSIVSRDLIDVQVTGAQNGFLLRAEPQGRTLSVRPQYLRVSRQGDVEVVATVPRDTQAVTADERFALLCDDRGSRCRWSVVPLAGGEARPLPSLARLVTVITDYDWQIDPYVVERADLLVVRDLGDYEPEPYPPVARCSLAQARCVRIRD